MGGSRPIQQTKGVLLRGSEAKTNHRKKKEMTTSFPLSPITVLKKWQCTLIAHICWPRKSFDKHRTRGQLKEEEDEGCVPIHSHHAWKYQSEVVEVTSLQKICPDSLNIETHSKCNLDLRYALLLVLCYLLYPTVLCVLLLLLFDRTLLTRHLHLHFHVSFFKNLF